MVDANEKNVDIKAIELSIKNTKSKYCIQVLEVLRDFPRMRQIDIAHRLSLPASNLQGVMKKIMNAEPALIICSENDGKSKIFKLTEAAEEYFDSLSGKEEDDIYFRRWVWQAGYAGWKSRLYAVLDHGDWISQEEKQVFRQLVNRIKLKNIQSGLELSKDFDDEQLFQKLKSMIQEEDSVSFHLKPLCELFHSEWGAALRLIDYIFSHHFYENLEDDYRIYKAFELADEDIYLKIRWALQELITECKTMLDKKEKIYQTVEGKMCDCGQMAFYLAEKIYAGRELLDKMETGENLPPE